MAEGRRMTAADVVADVLAGEQGDFVREAVAIVARETMDAQVSAEIGAAHGEVSVERVTHRNAAPASSAGREDAERGVTTPNVCGGGDRERRSLEPRPRVERAETGDRPDGRAGGCGQRSVECARDPRSWQRRRNGDEAAAGAQDAATLADDRLPRRRIDDVEQVGGRDDGERAIGERKPASVGRLERPPLRKGRYLFQHRCGGVDTDRFTRPVRVPREFT